MSEQNADIENDGCDCTELCNMGPTCPGGALAGLPGSGCHRVNPVAPDLLSMLGRAVEAARDALASCGTCGKRLPEQADPTVKVYCSPRCYGLSQADA